MRHTVEQAGLSGAARRENLRGAFRIRRNVRDLRVAIVDDVMTTGSTASELACSFRAAGAASVQVWTAALAPKM